MESILIQDIKREKLEEIMSDLSSLENNWTELGERPWTRENFEKELPGKWDLSVYASQNGKVVGYAIGSIDDGIGRLNKILVDRDFRGKGIANKLWEEFLERCRKKDIKKIEFKALTENQPATEFYKKNGCLFYGIKLGDDDGLRHQIKYVFRLKDRIGHSKPTINSEDIDAVMKAMHDGDIATGNVVNQFVSSMKEYTGRKYGLATTNGSSALHLALRSLNVKKGEEVIIPSFACGSVLSSVEHSQAKPTIVDINEHDYNLSFEDTKRKINHKTKAIILPHMFGKPIEDLESFLSLNVQIIEDCALSIGAEHQGKKIGGFGDISIFSFYATKLMTTGVGGMCLTDNEKIAQKLEDLTQYDNREAWGECYNYKMSDLQAALGLSQLKKIDSFVKRRREIAEKYTQMFKFRGVDFSFPALLDNERNGENKENIFFRYIIRHPEKDFFMENVKQRGVDVAKPVPKPLHSYLGFADSGFPNTAEAYKTALSIPIFPSLSDTEVEDIAGVLVNWKKEKV